MPNDETEGSMSPILGLSCVLNEVSVVSEIVAVVQWVPVFVVQCKALGSRGGGGHNPPITVNSESTSFTMVVLR